MSQEILSKFAQLQTENRNQKQGLKRYSQMLLARDEEITKLFTAYPEATHRPKNDIH